VKYRLMNVTTIVLIVGTVLLALMLPEHVLDRSNTLRVLCNLVIGWIPAIDNLSRISSFPQVTRLIFSFTWAATPIVAVIFLYDFLKTPLDPLTLVKYKSNQRALTFAVYVMLPILIYTAAVIVAGRPIQETGGTISDRFTRVMSSSRLWLGFGAAGTAVLIGFASSMFVFWTVRVRSLLRTLR